jgi:hypothetical protein
LKLCSFKNNIDERMGRKVREAFVASVKEEY